MTRKRTLVTGLLAGAALVAAAAQPAAAYSSPDHFWPDPINWGGGIPPAPATAEQVTITAPLEAPTAPITYAWIMTTGGGVTWTQIGLAWDQTSPQPYIFSDTSGLAATAPDAYHVGPSVPPGGSVTVRLVLEGSENVSPKPSTWLDEYRTAAGWQVLDRADLAAELTPPTLEAYFSGSGSPGIWLFRQVGWEAAGIWHHMASTGIGALAPELVTDPAAPAGPTSIQVPSA